MADHKATSHENEEKTEIEETTFRTTKLDDKEQKAILKQVRREFKIGFDYNQEKRFEWARRLKLYSNQKRDPAKVGDPLLFTVFQTVIAALYTDRLNVNHLANEMGDEETAENLNFLAEYDYRVMEKDELDYSWIWDAAFFGRSLMELNDFDPITKTPVAEVWDPLTTLRDPLATSVNGNQKGAGAARFLGREVSISLLEMNEHRAFFNLDLLLHNSQKRKSTGQQAGQDNTQKDDLIDEAQRARREMQNLQHTIDNRENSLENNREFEMIQWFTHRRGKKHIVTCSKDFQTLVRYQPIEGIWPIIDRVIFPMAHDWDGVSIPDLIEDKQRARSVMINLGMESAQASLYPQYLYNKKKIKNPRDLDFAFNKFVGIDGNVDGAIAPIQKPSFQGQVNMILNILDLAAQKAVAAPEIAQGVPPREDRTLGESELVAAGRSVRASLAAKIFGWSERRFWRQWYSIYKRRFKDALGEKTIRIAGPLGPVWRGLTRENIIANVDPDIYIESKSVSEAERAKQFQEFMTFANLALQDPTTNRRFIFRNAARILNRTKKEIDFMIPPDIDEMTAEDENVLINDGKFVPIDPLDLDLSHLVIHDRAIDGKAKIAHIMAHKEMMRAKKEKPEAFPQLQEDNFQFTPVQPGGSAAAPQGRQPPTQSLPQPREEQETSVNTEV